MRCKIGISLFSVCSLFLLLLDLFDGTYGRRCGKDAYITYAYSDLTAISASVLSKSLRASGSRKCRILMISNDISWLIRPFIETMFDEMIDVDLKTHNHRILHEEYGPIWAFNQTRYSRLAFIQNTAIALKNPDEIFNYPPLAATPDASWSDRFDINVFLMKPDQNMFMNLLTQSDKEYSKEDRLSFDWVFTSAVKEWNRMSCIYNVLSSLQDKNFGAYKKLFDTIKIARFTGKNLPWTVPLNLRSKLPEISIESVGHVYIELPFHEKWWNVFSQYVHSPLKKYLKKFNLGLVKKEEHLYLGQIDLHVSSGFYLWDKKSFPKFISKNGKTINNEYTTWSILMQGIYGYKDTGLDFVF